MALVVKNLPAHAGDLRDVGSIPGLGRSPAGGHGDPLQYSCPENPMDRGAWRAIVHRDAKRHTSLDRDDLLEEGMATHSSILARRIPWTEEPGGLQSVVLQRVGCNLASTHVDLSA